MAAVDDTATTDENVPVIVPVLACLGVVAAVLGGRALRRGERHEGDPARDVEFWKELNVEVERRRLREARAGIAAEGEAAGRRICLSRFFFAERT